MAQQTVTVSSITPTVAVGSATASTTELVTQTGSPLATAAEVIAGLSTTLAVTPAGLAADLAIVRDAQLHDSYAGKATGALVTADTGHTWALAGAATLSIIDGVVGSDDTGAGYADVDMGDNVTRVGARFYWESAGTTDGTLAILAWATSVTTAPFPPDSPCHLTVEPDQVGFGVWEDQVFAPLLTYNLPNVLEADGSTIYEVEVFLEGDVATIRMPDGAVITVTDSRINSIAAPFAGFEVVQDASDHFPRFLDVWADTRTDTPYGAMPLGSIYRQLAPFGGSAVKTEALNTAVGYQSQADGGGNSNTVVGAVAQQSLTTATTTTGVGYGVQQDLTTGNNNTAVGALAQTNLTTGATNSGFGNNAQRDLTTGGSNTAVGGSAQWAPAGVTANATTTASFQTSVGALSGLGGTTQRDYITTVGYSATSDAAGGTALGAFAEADHTNSVALGYNVQTTAAQQVAIEDRHIEGVELAADPANGAANSWRLYAKDDGGGKTQLYVRFGSGAAVAIPGAIEP